MSKVFRITGSSSLQAMIDAIDKYEPTEKELDEFEEAMRLGPPKEPKPRKSAKLVPKKESAINHLNLAGMASSFKKFCDSHGYICR